MQSAHLSLVNWVRCRDWAEIQIFHPWQQMSGSWVDSLGFKKTPNVNCWHSHWNALKEPSLLKFAREKRQWSTIMFRRQLEITRKWTQTKSWTRETRNVPIALDKTASTKCHSDSAEWVKQLKSGEIQSSGCARKLRRCGAPLLAE